MLPPSMPAPPPTATSSTATPSEAPEALPIRYGIGQRVAEQALRHRAGQSQQGARQPGADAARQADVPDDGCARRSAAGPRSSGSQPSPSAAHADTEGDQEPARPARAQEPPHAGCIMVSAPRVMACPSAARPGSRPSGCAPLGHARAGPHQHVGPVRRTDADPAVAQRADALPARPRWQAVGARWPMMIRSGFGADDEFGVELGHRSQPGRHDVGGAQARQRSPMCELSPAAYGPSLTSK
jgi:hypothetical protein